MSYLDEPPEIRYANGDGPIQGRTARPLDLAPAAEFDRLQMARMRSRARKHDLGIRTRRSSKVSGPATYAIVDSVSGVVIIGSLRDLDDLESHLWVIIHQRHPLEYAGSARTDTFDPFLEDGES